jgi:hypothetical protein
MLEVVVQTNSAVKRKTSGTGYPFLSLGAQRAVPFINLR